VARVPEYLTLKHHRDLKGRERRPWARWIALTAVGALLLAGLLNVFGQRPHTDVAENDFARLEVYSPKQLRSGLFYESRFHIDAHREIESATIVLDSGWLEGMTLNTLAPGPIGEASRDGRIALDLGRIPAGQKHLFFLHFQVNPTNIGHRAANVELHDGERPLLRLERTVTIWP
jgi:hypothetical protein